MEPDHSHTTPSVVLSDPNILLKAKGSWFAEGSLSQETRISNPSFSEVYRANWIGLYMEEMYIFLGTCMSNFPS